MLTAAFKITMMGAYSVLQYLELKPLTSLTIEPLQPAQQKMVTGLQWILKFAPDVVE